MPRFKVGDRVKVPEEMHGAKLEWLGKEGTVRAIPGLSTSGFMSNNRGVGPWQPFYDVRFDDATDSEPIDEDMLVPANESN